MHRETAAVPADRLAAEREMLHPLPDEPYALALGEERLVGDDQTVRFGSVRYSTPPGHAGTRAKIDDVISNRDRLGLVLHDENRVAVVAQSQQQTVHPLNVVRV